MVKEQLMTAGEVASYLRCSVSTVRRMAARGEMPHYRMGKMVRFRRSEVDTWLLQHHEGTQGDEGRRLLPDLNQLSLFGEGRDSAG